MTAFVQMFESIMKHCKKWYQTLGMPYTTSLFYHWEGVWCVSFLRSVSSCCHERNEWCWLSWANTLVGCTNTIIYIVQDSALCIFPIFVCYIVPLPNTKTGLEIATDMVANATNISFLVTKNFGLVAKMVTRFSVLVTNFGHFLKYFSISKNCMGRPFLKKH